MLERTLVRGKPFRSKIRNELRLFRSRGFPPTKQCRFDFVKLKARTGVRSTYNRTTIDKRKDFSSPNLSCLKFLIVEYESRARMRIIASRRSGTSTPLLILNRSLRASTKRYREYTVIAEATRATYCAIGIARVGVPVTRGS